MLGLYESFHIHSSRYQVDELNCFNRVLSLCSRLRGDEVRGFFFLHPFQRSSSKRKVFSKHKEKCQDKDGRKSIENDYKIICCCTIVGIITPAQVWPHWHTKKLPRKLTSVYMNAVLGCQGLTEGLPSPHQKSTRKSTVLDMICTLRSITSVGGFPHKELSKDFPILKGCMMGTKRRLVILWRSLLTHFRRKDLEKIIFKFIDTASIYENGRFQTVEKNFLAFLKKDKLKEETA